MPGLIGKKVGMTSMYSEAGKNLPCTVLEVGPCVVTQVKTADKDGYAAVQVGFGDRKENRTTKAMAGHFKKAGVHARQHLVEFSGFEQEYNPGDEVKLEDVFQEGVCLRRRYQQGPRLPGRRSPPRIRWCGSSHPRSAQPHAPPVPSVQPLRRHVSTRACAWPVRWAIPV